MLFNLYVALLIFKQACCAINTVLLLEKNANVSLYSNPSITQSAL